MRRFTCSNYFYLTLRDEEGRVSPMATDSPMRCWYCSFLPWLEATCSWSTLGMFRESRSNTCLHSCQMLSRTQTSTTATRASLHSIMPRDTFLFSSSSSSSLPSPSSSFPEQLLLIEAMRMRRRRKN